MKNKTITTRKTEVKSDHEQVINVPLEQIRQLENMRSTYREKDLSELMVSMRQTGLLQPIGLKALGAKEFEIVFGNRRFVAAKKLGWETIPALMVSAEGEADFLMKNTTENLLRQNVPLPEQGRIFSKLLKLGLSKEEVAARLGISKGQVTNALSAFREIPKKYQEKIVANTIGGTKPQKGQVSGYLATRVLGAASSFALDAKQREDLFTATMENGLSRATMVETAKLLAQGFEIQDAVKKSSELRTVLLNVMIEKDEIDKVEKKHNTGIVQFLYRILKDDGRVKLVKAGKTPKGFIRRHKQGEFTIR